MVPIELKNNDVKAITIVGREFTYEKDEFDFLTEKINNFIGKENPSTILNIEYTTVYNGSRIIPSALILYVPKKEIKLPKFNEVKGF